MKSQLRASWNCNSKERGKKWPPNLSQEADNFGSIYEFGLNEGLGLLKSYFKNLIVVIQLQLFTIRLVMSGGNH